MSVSERLKFARQASHLTLTEVELRTGIGSSTLSELENGKREPKLVQLKDLAELYRRSTAFFLADDPIPVERVLWSSNSGSPARERIQVQLLQLAEQYRNLELWCSEPAEIELPFVTRSNGRFGVSQAEKLAHVFRQQFGLGDRPGPSLLQVLEEVCKVKIFHLDLRPHAGYACTLGDRYGAVILLNSETARCRRNFDLACGLFHLLTWGTLQGTGEKERVEFSDDELQLAASFARSLLLPADAVRVALNSQLQERVNISFSDLFEISRQFDVDFETLLLQLPLSYRMSPDQVERTLGIWKQSIVFWEQRHQDKPLRRPVRFEVLATEALQKGLLSIGRYAEYLEMTRREAMRQLEQEIPADAEIEVAHS